MKKFLVAIFIAMFCSCDNELLIPGSPESLACDTKLVELTFEGHTHQFIFNHSYTGGYAGNYDVEIVHWPSCKYCNGDK